MAIQINWYRQLSLLIVPATGWFFGLWLEQIEDERLTRFRDKSALYGRVLAPGEKPSWP